MDKGRTQVNGSENEKVNAMQPRDDTDSLYESSREEGVGRASIEDTVDVSKGLVDNIKKSKERLIIETSISIDKIWANRRTSKARNQK